MANQELLQTPGGTRTTDTLREAYTSACFPTPFDREGDTSIADLVYSRIAGINFSPYWANIFEDFRRYNGCPAGMFSSRIFKAAETKDGIELQAIVAEELAKNFPEHVLEADIDSPILSGDDPNIVGQSPLAQLLTSAREQFESSVEKLYRAPKEISDAWVSFVNTLASADPPKHDFVLREMTTNYAVQEVESDEEIEEWGGMMGGYDSFDKRHALKREIAKVLAHFPDIVITHLKEPTIPDVSTELIPQ